MRKLSVILLLTVLIFGCFVVSQGFVGDERNRVG